MVPNILRAFLKIKKEMAVRPAPIVPIHKEEWMKQSFSRMLRGRGAKPVRLPSRIQAQDGVIASIRRRKIAPEETTEKDVDRNRRAA